MASSISRGPPLPGFGFPLGWEQQERDRKKWPLFRSALDPDIGYYGRSLTRQIDGQKPEYHKPDTWRMPLITLRETQMLAFINNVTDKDGWETKVLDKSITDKWKAEVLFRIRALTSHMKWRSTVLKSSSTRRNFSNRQDALQSALKSAVGPLEDVPEYQKDWHPGSDGRVLDLVHPSLYPLVYGLSRIVTNSVLDIKSGLERCCEGEVLPTPEIDPSPEQNRHEEDWEPPREESYSNRFQWLPCDVDISGDVPRIVSYINNLHPDEHAHLYSVIEQIIGKVLPVWNLTLTPFRHFLFQRRIVPDGQIRYGQLDDWAYVQKESPQEGEGESYSSFWGRQDEWKEELKPKFLQFPNATLFERPQPISEPVNLKTDFSDHGLQIIVKLANIHLTPEKPHYDGGSWHIEGQLNEHICASTIYYFDNENITPSQLSFRQATDAMEAECTDYEQFDVDWLEKFFGLEEHSSEGTIQYVGSVETREGRIISFPNILQHQVQPFGLKDLTKPGHRKILALFLVDPNTRIISTANVPCQQREWWARSIQMGDGTNRFVMLPGELREKIIEGVEDFPISLNDAKKLREELMKERKIFELFHKENFEGIPVSLCEH